MRFEAMAVAASVLTSWACSASATEVQPGLGGSTGGSSGTGSATQTASGVATSATSSDAGSASGQSTTAPSTTSSGGTTTASSTTDESTTSDSGTTGGTDPPGSTGSGNVCGDGVPGGNEQCDDMNADEADGCLSDCREGPTGFSFSAGDTLTSHGGAGGTLFEDECPAGSVLIGFRGSEAGVVDRIRGVCGTPALVGSPSLGLTIAESSELPLRGLANTTAYDRTCQAGHAVVGVSGNAGGLLDELVVRCAPLSIADDDVTITLVIGTPVALAAVGGDGGSAYGPDDCGAGQVANVANIRAGNSIDAMGLACTTIALVFP